MAWDASSQELDPNALNFSPSRRLSDITNADNILVSNTHSQPSSSSTTMRPQDGAQTQQHVLPPYHPPLRTRPYYHQGTVYYIPDHLPPQLLPGSCVPWYPGHNIDSGYGINQNNGFNYHHGNSYVYPFNTGHCVPYFPSCMFPSDNAYYYYHYYYYYHGCNYGNGFPFPTPYANGHTNPELFAPFTNQLSQVSGVRSGLLNARAGPTGNGDRKKKNKRNNNNNNKRKKNGENKDEGKGEKKDANKDDNKEKKEEKQANGEVVLEEAPDEANGNRVPLNGEGSSSNVS